ncbi:MAG: riboflavin synthase, partial [Candidatus Zixiibacteriota bacterium]
QYEPEYDQMMVRKGSIAIDGVSLTVNDVHSGSCSVNLIPHTLESTNLKNLKKGDEVNLEFDLIGKYISRMLADSDGAGLTIDKLKESGW